MFTKVKAAALALAGVILASVAAWAADFDWGTFGAFGPIVGAAIPVLVAYAVRELRGYGLGVPEPFPDEER
jgi:hypothetical protein